MLGGASPLPLPATHWIILMGGREGEWAGAIPRKRIMNQAARPSISAIFGHASAPFSDISGRYFSSFQSRIAVL